MKVEVELTDKATVEKLFSMYLKHMQTSTNVLNFTSNMVVEMCSTTPRDKLTAEYFEKMRRSFPIMKVRKESNFSMAECNNLIDTVLRVYVRRAKNGEKPVRVIFAIPDLTDQYEKAKELMGRQD